MAERTPTPWVVSGDLRHVYHDQPEGSIAISANGRWLGLAVVNVTPSRASEAAANAEFIVRACNAHADLLTALERIVAAWESIDQDTQVPDEINDDDLWIAARAAVRKATGEESRP